MTHTNAEYLLRKYSSRLIPKTPHHTIKFKINHAVPTLKLINDIEELLGDTEDYKITATLASSRTRSRIVQEPMLYYLQVTLFKPDSIPLIKLTLGDYIFL